MKVTNWPYLIPNFVILISVSWEKSQASKEEITSCRISHPPSNSLPNKISVINNLDDEECL